MPSYGLHLCLRHQRPPALAHDPARGQGHLQHLRQDAERRLHHQPPEDARPNQLQHNNCNKDSNDVCNSSSITHVTSSGPSMSRGGSTNSSSSSSSNAVTIATQMSLGNITSGMGLQHPVTITGPVNISSVHIPTTASMSLAHPMALTSPMSMNIAGPLNIAMRPMESMSFLSQVLPSSPPLVETSTSPTPVILPHHLTIFLILPVLLLLLLYSPRPPPLREVVYSKGLKEQLE
ncbi:vascular endothelial zinc finger 1-like isoform X2 [Clupea harengus]|uniref:Vascular endothelial zinc finger 1-like isoform X2 n=1 Tax=Clupea harengus TaxID=7950 RepID=A0A8M1KD74_CLUHA|nr:vascular endothelial zinc finger 1-like isoform X2 [Clupea harengus]